MATARTNIDALGYYASDPDSRGGIRADLEINPLEAFVNTPIGPVIIQHVTPNNGEGTGTIEATSTTALAYTAPSDTAGSGTTVAANTSVLLESGTAAKGVRVYRDSAYSADDLGGDMTLDLYYQMNNAIAGADADENGGDYYSCFYIYNHSDADITSITLTPAELGTAVTTDSAQLGASGSGTITTTGSLVDWPDSGWAHIRTSGAATRELIYYTSRTSTSLTVPAAGRELLGTTAAAGASDDTATPVAPIRLWAEDPGADGVVQEIADNTTAPAGPSWSFSDAVGTLEPGEERAVWIHRDVPAGATVNTEQLSGVKCAFTYGATPYTPTVYGYFRIGDTALELYELHVGEDAQPTFASATATSSTLPFTQALSVSTDNYYATRYRNKYNLESFNVLTELTVTGSGGEDETPVLTAPTVVSLTAQPGGEVDLILNYNGSADATVADTWRLYVTTDGTNPDAGVDSPSDTAMSVTGLALPNITQTITLGPYDYGTDFRVIPRVYSSTLDDESDNVAVSTLTVDTQNPIVPNWMGITTGAYRGHKRVGYDSTTYYNDPTNTVGIQILTGETVVFGTSEAFRGILGNENRFRTGIEFSNVTHSAAGTSAAIEVVSGTEFYINVNSTRRAKIDLSGGTIEAATFVFQESAISLPVIGPTYTTTAETYIMVFNGITGRWTPLCKVDSSGVFTTTATVLQERT